MRKKAKLFTFEKGKEKKAESMIKVCFAKRVTKDHVKFQEILNANPDDGKKSPKAVPMLSSMASTQESKQVVLSKPLPGHHTRVLAWRMGCPHRHHSHANPHGSETQVRQIGRYHVSREKKVFMLMKVICVPPPSTY